MTRQILILVVHALNTMEVFMWLTMVLSIRNLVLWFRMGLHKEDRQYD